MSNYYTVYIKKTDEIVCYGTAKECARAMGTTLNSFYSTVSKSRKGKRHKYDVLIETGFSDEDADSD